MRSSVHRLAIAAIGTLVLSTHAARADFISTLSFTTDSALGGGPFGTVDISLGRDLAGMPLATITITRAPPTFS